LSIDESSAAIVAVGICKVAKLDISISKGSDQLVFTENNEEIKGDQVVETLLSKASSLQGSDDKEKQEVSTWASKKTNIGELNNHLSLRVYVADGTLPTIADLQLFAMFRDQISKQKVPQRNQFANVTRWFNHLQPLFEPYFPSVAIKLSYTAPKKPEKGKGKGKGDDKPKKGNQGQRRAPEEKITGFARLRLQVGKIVSIEVHSSVPSLYVEQIDLGEEKPRTVVSKLAERIPIEQMRDRLVIVGTNLQPADLQGVVSEGLVFCASKGDDVEVLTPPEGSTIGEDIKCEGVNIVPEPGQTITRKIFGRAVKGLQTNDSCVACYKDTPLSTSKGNVTVSSLKGAEIK